MDPDIYVYLFISFDLRLHAIIWPIMLIIVVHATLCVPISQMELAAVKTAFVSLPLVILALLTAIMMQEMVVRWTHQAMWITVMDVITHVLMLPMAPLPVKIASV